MRGEILHYDQTTGQGFIAGQDGRRYTFHISYLQQPVVPTAGSTVDFIAAGDSAHEIFIVGGVAAPGTVPQAHRPIHDGPPPELGLWEYFIAGLTRNYANFNGRARRKEYWGFVLFSLLGLVAIGAVAVIGITTSDFREANQSYSPVLWLAIVAYALFALYLILPSIAVTVRRFHDIGQSGWIYLLLIIVGIVPFLGLISTIAIFVITVLDSQPGENKYGVSPKGHWVPSR